MRVYKTKRAKRIVESWPRPEMIGIPFGVLTERAGRNPSNRSHATFRCACGHTFVANVSNVQRGHTKSCGCLSGVIASNESRTHGKSKTPTYRNYLQMIRRCENDNTKCYRNYGGRGISVCRRWRNSYEAFLADMGERPSAQHSIDRIDNDGNYCPENCRWATKKRQNRNKRTTRWLTIRNVTMSAVDWADVAGVDVRNVYWRSSHGWPDDEAVLGRRYEQSALRMLLAAAETTDDQD